MIFLLLVCRVLCGCGGSLCFLLFGREGVTITTSCTGRIGRFVGGNHSCKAVVVVILIGISCKVVVVVDAIDRINDFDYLI